MTYMLPRGTKVGDIVTVDITEWLASGYIPSSSCWGLTEVTGLVTSAVGRDHTVNLTTPSGQHVNLCNILIDESDPTADNPPFLNMSGE